VVCAYQFQPQCGHFHESVGPRFAMGLPQRGQVRIQIFFVTAISHLLNPTQSNPGFIVADRRRRSNGAEDTFSGWFLSTSRLLDLIV
jgi:hypothetical protein